MIDASEVTGRTATFHAGARGPGVTGTQSTSLGIAQGKFNSAVKTKVANPLSHGVYHPSSILTAGQVIPSQSGYSMSDYSRVTPEGMLPTMNGMAADTYMTLNPRQFGTKLTI